MTANALSPHGNLETLAPGLHCVAAAFNKTPLGRRMTLFELPGGKLAVHSGIALADDAMTQIDKLGEVAYIVVPNTGHDSDAPFYAARYPRAVVLAPTAHAAKLRRKMRVDGTLEDKLPPALAAVLDNHPVRGTRMHECAFLHRASRTLVLTDLAFNFTEADFGGLTLKLMRFNRATSGFGPSRLATSWFFKDNAALGASLREMYKNWDFDRIVVSHGRIVERGGREVFARAFAPWLSDGAER